MRSAENPVVRAQAMVRDNWARAQRRLAPDVELQNLKQLEAAYRGASGPEVLVFGDSAMFWVSRLDRDRRHLIDMLREELGDDVRVHATLGRGYNARMVMTFMAYLARCRSKPRVVVAPASVIFVMDIWLAHPELGHARTSAALMELLRSNGPRPKRLPPPSEAEVEAYDRMEIPGLVGGSRTAGEIRLIANSTPQSTWQTIVRQRTLYDYYNAEDLRPDGDGPKLLEAMGAMITRAGCGAVAYLHPIDVGMTGRLLGDEATARIAANADVVAEAFQRGAGELGVLVNAAYDCDSDEYTDPVHLNDRGRVKLADRIARGVEDALQRVGTSQSAAAAP